jgi:hypothetical protein
MYIVPDPLIKFNPQKKYGLYKLKDSAPVLIKEIAPAKIEQFITNSQYVNLFQVFKDRFSRAEMNLIELSKSALEGFRLNLGQSQLTGHLDEDRFDLLNANRLCSNYVYSWFNCIELMEVQIKRDYADDNPEKLQKWTTTKNYFYKTFFEYRFSYTIRNFLHTNNLLSGLYYQNGKITALVSKAKLVSFKDFQKTEFATDWPSMKPTFPVIPIFEKSISVLREISQIHLELNRELFMEHANSIKQNFGSYPKFKVGVTERPLSGQIALQEVPTKLVDSLISHYDG